jgi:pyridoxine kinase
MKLSSPQPKRVLSIQDLSSFGNTSLQTEIALMTRLGIRVCALPTAILSANTDFPEPRWVDFSSHIYGFTRHWLKLGLTFDAIHTGFLSSPKQAEEIAEVIGDLRGKHTTVLVDPVMGDNGMFYKCYEQRIVPAMRLLIGSAQIITPNLTEAAFLIGKSPPSHPDPQLLVQWCKTLSGHGPRHVVITSIPNEKPNHLGVLHYDAETDTTTELEYEKTPGIHPGAGDSFASLLLAGIVNGHGVPASLKAAVSILNKALQAKPPVGSDPREGIALEQLMVMDLSREYQT